MRLASLPAAPESCAGADAFGPVLLDDRVRITRRLQTHRRHLGDRTTPEGYLRAAAAL